MNNKILSIEPHQGQKLVKFEGSIGIGFGVWMGELPAQGESIDVEIDVDDDLKWGRNIIMTSENVSMIALKNNQFHFVAEVLSYEDDGCLSVRLGDGIILLDVEDAPNDIKGWVECRAESVKLYPTNM
jgi:hypothetical protein